MNRTRMLLLAAFAIAVSVAATWMAYTVLSPRFAPADDTIEIVVALDRIPLGTALTEPQLQLVQWPRASAPAGSFTSAEEIIGRCVISTIYRNEPILNDKLSPEGTGAGLYTTIPEGMRAISVRVNEVIGVAGFVTPGTRVDVILAGSPEVGGQSDTAKIFLENIQVLASGQNVEDVNGQPQQVQVITLVVTPDDAQRLALATVDGQIQLALRNPLDPEPTDPAPVLRRSLYQRRQADPEPEPVPTVARAVASAPRLPPPPPPPPAPPQPVPFSVEVIQGTATETVTYDIDPTEISAEDQ